MAVDYKLSAVVLAARLPHNRRSAEFLHGHLRAGRALRGVVSEIVLKIEREAVRLDRG